MSRAENCEWCLTPHNPVVTACPDDDAYDPWSSDDNSDDYWRTDPLAYRHTTEAQGDLERCNDCGNWHSELECP